MSKPEDDVIILGFKCPLCGAVLGRYDRDILDDPECLAEWLAEKERLQKQHDASSDCKFFVN